jgi:hypothetical protein
MNLVQKSVKRFTNTTFKDNFNLKPFIEEHFDVILYKTDIYHPFDFRDEHKVFYNIYTKWINHNKYPTVNVDVKKIEMANLSDKDVYFIFKFNNGTYYYKYNRNIHDGLTSGLGKDKSFVQEYKPYVWIPISKLVLMKSDDDDSQSVKDYKEKAGDNQYKELSV